MNRGTKYIVCLCIAGASAFLAGCTDPILTPDEPRSQYDRNDAIRDRRAPTFVYDEKGNRKPNIRGRLLTGGE